MIDYPESGQATPRAADSDAEGDAAANNAFEPSVMQQQQQRSSMRPSASTTASAAASNRQQQQSRERQQQPPPNKSAAGARTASGAGGQASHLPHELATAGTKKAPGRRARVVDAPNPANDDDDDRDLLEPEPEDAEPEYEPEPSPGLARAGRKQPAGTTNEPATRAKTKPAPVASAQPRRVPPAESTAIDGDRPSRDATRTTAKKPPASAAQRQRAQNGSEKVQVANAPRAREQTRRAPAAQQRLERSPDDLEPELEDQMERDSLKSDAEEQPNEFDERVNSNAAPTRQTKQPLQNGARLERAPSRERASPTVQRSALPSRLRSGPMLSSTLDDGAALRGDAAAGGREARAQRPVRQQPLEQAVDSEPEPTVAVYTRSMAPLSSSLRERVPSPSRQPASGAREQVPVSRLTPSTRASPLPRLERERTYYISEEELVVPGPPAASSVPVGPSTDPMVYGRNSNCPLCGSPLPFAVVDRQEHERRHQQLEPELLTHHRGVTGAAAVGTGTRFTTRRPVLVEREYVLDEPSAVGVPTRFMRPLDPADFADPELQRQAQLLEQHADARAAHPDEYFLSQPSLLYAIFLLWI